MKSSYKAYDKENMFSTIFSFAEQLEKAIEIGQNLSLRHAYSGIEHIIFAGMGGSAIAGDIVSLLCAATTPIPTVTSRTYTLPSWANAKTLVICMSYSGNTEETLASFEDARAKGAHIIGITSGGFLATQLKQYGYDSILIPGGIPPRASLGYLAVPLLFLMHRLNLLPHDFLFQLHQAISLLKEHRLNWSLEQEPENLALSIAHRIYQSYPLIYGEADKTSIVARRFRGQLAENSKMLSGSHELPELDHNEIVGFHNNPEILKRCGVIWLIDQEMSEPMLKRFQVTWEIIDPLVNYQISLQAQGNSFIERMIYLIHLIDWISFWCAILHREDPTPVDRINRLKQLLTK
ncbi:bifunctional phosphoglucose/phosphomannose isomerase [Candidatus Dependentiae bacterium]|nr:bifunctional phosphoglucose/phosphomannose isomerase [Candidatus Dependentiae bacterium]